MNRDVLIENIKNQGQQLWDVIIIGGGATGLGIALDVITSYSIHYTKLYEAVDTLLVINNERLREVTGNLSFTDAFAKADDILATAAKGIAEVIEITGAINVDFNDVNTVMKNSGVAIMGNGIAEGENRAIKAVEKALESPLLNDNDISGAEYVLLNISYNFG